MAFTQYPPYAPILIIAFGSWSHAQPSPGTQRAILFFHYDVRRSESQLLFRDPCRLKNSRCAVLHLAARHGSNSGNHLKDWFAFLSLAGGCVYDAMLRDTAPVDCRDRFCATIALTKNVSGFAWRERLPCDALLNARPLIRRFFAVRRC